MLTYDIDMSGVLKCLLRRIGWRVREKQSSWFKDTPNFIHQLDEREAGFSVLAGCTRYMFNKVISSHKVKAVVAVGEWAD